MTFHDSTIPGTRFNSFTFIRYTNVVNGNRYALFRCDCGRETETQASSIKNGHSKSCNKCASAGRNLKHGHAAHDICSKTYYAWASMKKRCLDPNHPSYKDYGGRGIKICERWLHSFEAFLLDVGEIPQGKTLDRWPDKNGNYEPGNVRLASIKEQNNNKRNNTVLEFDGRAMTISQWADILGIKDCTISERLRHGWSVERTLTSPARNYIAAGGNANA